MLIRPSKPDDLDGITSIYAHHVLSGTGTFETAPPGLEEMTRRHAEVLARRLPWLVVQQGGRLMGFAYANAFRPRPAYRFTLEDSVYLHPEAMGHGVGRILLTELLARCEDSGHRQMLAVIGDSENAGSIGLHRAAGFVDAGVLRCVGWKFGRWLDVVLMQRSLGLASQPLATDGAL